MNIWKYDHQSYCLYIQSSKVKQSINRYYIPKGFRLMSVYTDRKGKPIGYQYHVPIEHLKAAKRLAEKDLQQLESAS